jgi:hypothetical protein
MSMNDGRRDTGHVAAPEGSLAGVERGRAARIDAAEPIPGRAGGAGGQGDRVARGRRRAELFGRGAPGRSPRRRHRGGLGRPLQPRGARRGTAGPRRKADPLLRRRAAAAHPRRSPAGTGPRARRHGHLELEHAAAGVAPGRGRAAHHQHLHDLAHPARGRPELAEQPDLVHQRHRGAPAPARRGGHDHRRRRRGEKS